MGKKGGSIGGGKGLGGFGLFFGNVVTCDSKDDTMYCRIIKMFNLLIICLIILYVLWVVYGLLKRKK